VVARKLSLEDISRISVSPFFVGFRCGLCGKMAYCQPKCLCCGTSYHYKCAIVLHYCCGSKIFPNEESTLCKCPRCNSAVEYGPECTVCHKQYHIHCLSPYDQCCRHNIYEPSIKRECGKCRNGVDFGPKCPLCINTYHTDCVGEVFECCKIKFTPDDDTNYRCRRCKRKVMFTGIMCPLCGELYHRLCLIRAKNCCGKPLRPELYLIPSFKIVVNHFSKANKRKSLLQNSKQATYALRSLVNIEAQSSNEPRVKKKSTSCQTNPLDNVTIVEVKTELEEKEVEIPCSPPIFEREISYSPEPSSSGTHKTDLNGDCEDTLRNLFDFLYNMVKKFPPHLQTQVKIDLFKTVTEADMQWQCDMTQQNRK
jgi:hypothetical protein